MGPRGKAGHLGGGKGLLDSSFRKDGGVFDTWMEAESQATSGSRLSVSLRGPARKCKETRGKEGLGTLWLWLGDGCPETEKDYKRHSECRLFLLHGNCPRSPGEESVNSGNKIFFSEDGRLCSVWSRDEVVGVRTQRGGWRDKGLVRRESRGF